MTETNEKLCIFSSLRKQENYQCAGEKINIIPHLERRTVQIRGMTYNIRFNHHWLPSHQIILFQTILSFLAPIPSAHSTKVFDRKDKFFAQVEWTSCKTGFNSFVVRRKLLSIKPPADTDKGHFFHQSCYHLYKLPFQDKRGLVSPGEQSQNLSTCGMALNSLVFLRACFLIKVKYTGYSYLQEINYI